MENYTKLCESVGIKVKMLCDCEYRNLYLYRISYGNDVCEYADENTKISCIECEKGQCNIPYYPDFTAEKQIELIKLISKDFSFNCYFSLSNNNYVVGADAYFFNKTCDFSEALAGLALQLVEAGELDKEEVRKVLE